MPLPGPSLIVSRPAILLSGVEESVRRKEESGNVQNKPAELLFIGSMKLPDV
jgi:hypothetical protein